MLASGYTHGSAGLISLAIKSLDTHSEAKNASSGYPVYSIVKEPAGELWNEVRVPPAVTCQLQADL